MGKFVTIGHLEVQSFNGTSSLLVGHRLEVILFLASQFVKVTHEGCIQFVHEVIIVGLINRCELLKFLDLTSLKELVDLGSNALTNTRNLLGTTGKLVAIGHLVGKFVDSVGCIVVSLLLVLISLVVGESVKNVGQLGVVGHEELVIINIVGGNGLRVVIIGGNGLGVRVVFILNNFELKINLVLCKGFNLGTEILVLLLKLGNVGGNGSSVHGHDVECL